MSTNTNLEKESSIVVSYPASNLKGLTPVSEEDLYTRTKGWTKEELESIADNPEAFIEAMIGQGKPNTLLVAALCEELGTDQAFEAVIDYLQSEKIFNDPEEAVNTSVGIFFRTFWTEKVEKYRKEGDEFAVDLKERLTKLLSLTQRAHPIIKLRLLLELSFVGRDEVIDFIRNTVGSFDSEVRNWLANNFAIQAEKAKEKGILSIRDLERLQNIRVIPPL